MLFFRLTPEQVWRLTPRHYVALMDAHRESLSFWDAEFGASRAVLANVHRGKKARPYQIEDFALLGSNGAKSTSKSTPESMLAYVENYLHPLLKKRSEIEKKMGLGKMRPEKTKR